nr:helix-turn-helix domain-containing protein [uncultured Roseateles sp.]
MPHRTPTSDPTDEATADYSTMEVARMLGLAVRSVQLMVDRGELSAWKTPGGHRRIAGSSVQAWLAGRGAPQGAAVQEAAAPRSEAPQATQRVLLIEDSVHYQNLTRLLLKQQFPAVELHIAHDGIVGLAMYGQLQPQVLIIDILLPGIDGATLITSLRSQPQFAHSRLIVVTSLDEAQRAPYAFALADLPVVHKPRLVMDLPALLEQALQPDAQTAGSRP